jgi:Protein of unknown function (DUF3558)
MRLAITLLLAAVAVTACGQPTRSATPPSTTSPSTTSASPSVEGDTFQDGGSVDTCKYIGQSEAEALLGAKAVAAGKLTHITENDSTCAYAAADANVDGFKLAVSVTVFTGPLGPTTVTEFQGDNDTARPVTGLGYAAARSANGAQFAATKGNRGCLVAVIIEQPADPDGTSAKESAICKKVLG